MTSLASPPTASTNTRTARWNTWYTVTLLLGAGWIVWAAVVLGRLSHGEGEPVPRSLNAIALVGLGCGAVLTFIAGKFQIRDERDTQWQAAVIAELEQIRAEQRTIVRDEIAKPMTDAAAGIARLNDRIGMRQDDDPTVPLAGRLNGHRTVYASASVATTVHGVQLDGFLSTLRAQVDERIDAAISRVEEHGAQRYFAGYAACAEDMSGGSVVALQPRNGQRSSTS